MKAAIVTFGLFIGFFQSSLIPGITLVGAQTSVPLQTSCTALNDTACVTCDTIGICSATITDAVVTEKCGTGTYCDAATGTCSATPSTLCTDPCAGAVTGCVDDPLNPGVAFISCDPDKQFSLLCVNDAGTAVVRVPNLGLCSCNADTTIASCDVLVSTTCAAYIPPGVDRTCADEYFYCNGATTEYSPFDCQLSGTCFNADVNCSCVEPVETTTQPASSTVAGGGVCPACSYLSDGVTEDGYYACFEGTATTMGGRMSCSPGLFVQDTCDCVCSSEGCTYFPNDETPDACEDFYSCNTNPDGTIERGEYNCPEGQCYSEAKCICDVPEPSTTTLGPGVTEPSSCDSYDTICPTVRPDTNDTKSYYLCGDGADLHMACATDSLFVYEKCGCLPCQSSGASYTEISCEEYYYCDYATEIIALYTCPATTCWNATEGVCTSSGETVGSTTPAIGTTTPAPSASNCSLCEKVVNAGDPENCYRSCRSPTAPYQCCPDGFVYDEDKCDCIVPSTTVSVGGSTSPPPASSFSPDTSSSPDASSSPTAPSVSPTIPPTTKSPESYCNESCEFKPVPDSDTQYVRCDGTSEIKDCLPTLTYEAENCRCI